MERVTLEVPQAVIDVSEESGVPVLRLVETAIRLLLDDSEHRPVPEYHHRKEEWNG